MDADHLKYMADQIIRNFAVRGEEAAIVATAQHIRDFWDSRMIKTIVGSQIDPTSQLSYVLVVLIQGNSDVIDSPNEC